jgi:hypothetical protein
MVLAPVLIMPVLPPISPVVAIDALEEEDDAVSFLFPLLCNSKEVNVYGCGIRVGKHLHQFHGTTVVLR